MKRFGLLVTACTLLVTAPLASPAWSQSLGEKSGVNSALDITPKTSDFVKEAATSGMFEIQSSQLAATRTQGDVQSFANQMVTDHTRIAGELKPLAQQAKISVPAQLTSSQQSMLDKLRGLKGDDFTKQYVSDQVSAHKDAVSLFQRYGKGGDNAQLKAFANQNEPTLQHHLDMAQSLNK